MTASSKKITESSRKTRSFKKNNKSLDFAAQKQKQKTLSGKKSLAENRKHSVGWAPVKGETPDYLGDLVRHQADDLKAKDGQIREWKNKENWAEAQVFIRTKAMDATTEGIFIIDAQGNNFPIIYSNQSFQEMIGSPKKDIIGKNYFLLYQSSTDAHIAEEIKNTLRQDKPFHGEMLNFRKNGEKFWNYLRIAPVRDSNGLVTHYVGIQTDVTLMRQRDLEIKEQREELLHVTRVGKLAEFVSSLAHEISQPLTAILSYAQAAQRMLAEREPQIQEILSHIVSDDQRATEVIRRLRSLLKKSDPELEPLDMNALINETVELMATDVTVRNKVIKTDFHKKLPLIQGDRVQLQQVLLNLISNSLDAMESSKKFRELVIRTSRKNSDMIMVKVEDSGCGIPAQNMKRLFKHFFTSKPDGLGMGLSISRSIVEAHGGRLDVEDNPVGGAVFYFILPVIPKGSFSRKESV